MIFYLNLNQIENQEASKELKIVCNTIFYKTRMRLKALQCVFRKTKRDNF